MNSLRARAEAGRATAQTQLADFCLASADFTNAVLWYRRAAEQGHVAAKLSLAGCVMTGRGTARNPGEAAQLLRQAADLIEAGASLGSVTTASAPAVTNSPSVKVLPPSPTLPMVTGNLQREPPQASLPSISNSQLPVTSDQFRGSMREDLLGGNLSPLVLRWTLSGN